MCIVDDIIISIAVVFVSFSFFSALVCFLDQHEEIEEKMGRRNFPSRSGGVCVCLTLQNDCDCLSCTAR